MEEVSSRAGLKLSEDGAVLVSFWGTTAYLLRTCLWEEWGSGTWHLDPKACLSERKCWL